MFNYLNIKYIDNLLNHPSIIIPQCIHQHIYHKLKYYNVMKSNQNNSREILFEKRNTYYSELIVQIRKKIIKSQRECLQKEMQQKNYIQYINLLENIPESLNLIASKIQDNQFFADLIVNNFEKIQNCLNQCHFQSWRYLCQIITQVIRLLPDRIDNLIGITQSGIVYQGNYFRSEYIMFKSELTKQILQYFVVIAPKVHLINTQQYKILVQLLRQQLICFNEQYQNLQQISLVIEILNIIFSIDDQIKPQHFDKKLYEIKIRKFECLNFCFFSDPRAIFKLFIFLQGTHTNFLKNILNLLINVTYFIEKEQYKMIIYKIDVFGFLIKLFKTDLDVHIKKLLLTLLNNLIIFNQKFLQRAFKQRILQVIVDFMVINNIDQLKYICIQILSNCLSYQQNFNLVVHISNTNLLSLLFQLLSKSNINPQYVFFTLNCIKQIMIYLKQQQFRKNWLHTTNENLIGQLYLTYQRHKQYSQVMNLVEQILQMIQSS